MTDTQRQIQAALSKAIQLADIASDWNLNEVEIDKKMVDVLILKDEFDHAYRLAGGRLR